MLKLRLEGIYYLQTLDKNSFTILSLQLILNSQGASLLKVL